MKNPMQKVLLALVLAAVAACTTTDEIIIDRKGVDPVRYESDLADCREYSSEVKTGEKAARGAASGAVIVGAIGSITGDSKRAAEGAGVGAVTGGARGASQGERSEIQVVKNCLRGRGYRVLN